MQNVAQNISDNIPMVIGSESNLNPNPLCAVTVTDEGHTSDEEGGLTSVSQASSPQVDTVVQ